LEKPTREVPLKTKTGIVVYYNPKKEQFFMDFPDGSHRISNCTFPKFIRFWIAFHETKGDITTAREMSMSLKGIMSRIE